MDYWIEFYKTFIRNIMMKSLFQAFVFTFLAFGVALADFPDKPIKIVVYTGPGGLIDITARKFTAVAYKYVDATFVVENKPGAGGIVALKKVLQAPEDGYTLYACTKSNIAKFVLAGVGNYVDALHWTAMLMADPECVITNKKNSIYEWQAIVNHAKNNPGEQNWVGPATGGLDHITAMKIWDKYNIDAKWIPSKSGGKAIAELLGKRGIAYVGNPRDALGNPDLYIAAVSSSQRLNVFPDTPTFTELGMPDLENEFMWRGFALKAGTSPEIIDWYTTLFKKVTADPDWREFWSRGGIDVEFIGGDEFAEMVHEDVATFEYYLKKSAIISDPDINGLARFAQGYPLMGLIIGLIVILILFGIRIYRSNLTHILGRVMVIGFFLIVSTVFYLQSLIFPINSVIGAAAVPRLWITVLIPLNLLLLVRTIKRREEIGASGSKVNLVLTFIGFLVVYLIAMLYIGYFISTFIFVVGSTIYLGYDKLKISIIVATVWVLFSYIVFYKILFVPLPMGAFFNGLF